MLQSEASQNVLRKTRGQEVTIDIGLNIPLYNKLGLISKGKYVMKPKKNYLQTRSNQNRDNLVGGESIQPIQPLLYQRFRYFLSKSKEAKLVNGIYNYYGKNFSIEYKDKFNFRERWEELRTDYALDDYLLEDANIAYSFLSLVVLAFNILAIWALSTERYFGTRLITDQLSLFGILIGLKMVQALAKTLMKCKREDWNMISFRSFLKVNGKELICLFYFIFCSIVQERQNICEHLVQLLVYYLLWSSASNIYQNFKLRSFALRYQNQLKIFDLLANLFIQAHIFAIMIQQASTVNPTTNWATAIGVADAHVFTRYLYAYYFSCTTMLTIGYGDITPKNPHEVIVVILIEITGVISFGYLLNEMGHTLSKMRQEKETLEKDLQTIGKMANYYNLEKNLENRAKKYIITNTKIMDELRPDDENKLLMKLNDELRTQITNENYLSILKTSIFFLCHWSKGFQSQIARSLQKRLFSPNERLGDTGIERIYIIKTGKVCIYMNRFSNNKKLLRTIEIDPELTVSNNIYGYTSAFSNRPVHLEAIAKELTTTYSITKQLFLQCVGLDRRDSEYYHEIKCRIDQSSFCEEWEAPSIKNIREHYIPSKIFLIKKYRVKLAKQVNGRKIARRRPYQKYRLFNNLVMSNAETVNPFNTSYTLGEKTLQFQLAAPVGQHDKRMSMSLSDEFEESSEAAIDSFSSSSDHVEEDAKAIRERSIELAKEYFNTRKGTCLEESANKQIIAYIFEKRRDYSNFFPKNNFHHILLKFEKENCQEGPYQYKM